MKIPSLFIDKFGTKLKKKKCQEKFFGKKVIGTLFVFNIAIQTIDT